MGKDLQGKFRAAVRWERQPLEASKGEVGRAFPQEQEYQEKSARLKELNVLLKLDEKDHEIFEVEPDDYDMEPPPRAMAIAR